jgi:DNA-damage-inducible protein D
LKTSGIPTRAVTSIGLRENSRRYWSICVAEERIRKEDIQGIDNASDAHFAVGKNVREAIKKSRGTLPEDQPTPISGITEIERQQIRALKGKKKMLDE